MVGLLTLVTTSAHAHPLINPQSRNHRLHRTPRSVVQNCVTPTLNVKERSPILGGGKFLRRFKKHHTQSYLRAKADRLVGLSGCLHGSFEDRETVKIMLLADGYTDRERDAALEHIATVGNALLTREPFRRYKKILSVCYKVIPSQVSGASEVGTEPNCAGVERAICSDPTKVRGFSTIAGTTPHVTGVLYNSDEYYGASQYWDGLFTISRNSSVGALGKPQYYWLAVHEFLHTCCSSPAAPVVRRFPTHQISRSEYKIQDEYPVSRFQCDESKAYNLGTQTDTPWAYLPKNSAVGTIPFTLSGAFCAYKPTEGSIMSTLRNPEINLPTQAGWIRQAVGTIKLVYGIKIESKRGVTLSNSRVVLEGPERLPSPVIDWVVGGKERVECRNEVACSLRKLRLGRGVHSITVRVGSADPVLNPDELPALTDEFNALITIPAGGRTATNKSP